MIRTEQRLHSHRAQLEAQLKRIGALNEFALIAAEALKEIRGRLGFLTNVGLDYLALDRTAPTLSGGESQRIRLAGHAAADSARPGRRFSERRRIFSVS